MCELCNYETINSKYFWAHCKTKTHVEKEEEKIVCIKCNKVFKNIFSLRNHRKNIHNNIYNKNFKNKTDNNTIINEIKENTYEIKKDNLENTNIIKEEVREVKKSVNKAINKATHLIKYLMKHHSSVPCITKMTKNKCVDRLRLDYECPFDNKNKYILHRTLVYQYIKGYLIDNLSKTILNLLNHKKPDLQPIYNTDSSRKNYVIKTKDWNEDLAGVKFTDYIIKPLLNSIGSLLKDYRENELESVNMRKNTLSQNEELNNQMYNTLKFESDIYHDMLIKPLLNKLTPYLRYLEEEIEELQKYNDIEKMQKELEELEKMIDDSSSNESESDMDDIENTEDIRPKKKINKKISYMSSDESDTEDIKLNKRINKRIIKN